MISFTETVGLLLSFSFSRLYRRRRRFLYEYTGCLNCKDLQIAEDRDGISKYTTPHFEGIIGLIKPKVRSSFFLLFFSSSIVVDRFPSPFYFCRRVGLLNINVLWTKLRVHMHVVYLRLRLLNWFVNWRQRELHTWTERMISRRHLRNKQQRFSLILKGVSLSFGVDQVCCVHLTVIYIIKTKQNIL